MSRITKPLTNTEVERAKYKDKIIKLFDGQGLVLKVTAVNKIWLFDYARPYTKKRTSISLGSYPELSLAQARAKRDEYRALLAQNIDPMQYRNDQTKQAIATLNNTFERLADEWLSKQTYSKSAYTNATMHLKYAKQCFGKKAVTDITVHDVLACCRIYEARGTLSTSQAIKVKVNQVLSYAIGIGVLDRNVINDIGKSAIKSQRHVSRPAITDPAEFLNMMAFLWRADNMHIETKEAFWMLAMLFCRPIELLSMRLEDIDLETKQWRYTPSKTQHSTMVQMIVPLPTQAMEIITGIMQRNQPKVYLFETTKRRGVHHPMDKTTLSKYLKNNGYRNIHCPHGFRASAKTILEEQFEFDPRYTEMQLGHVVKDSNGKAYNRATFLKQRAEMLQAWADWIDTAKNL